MQGSARPPAESQQSVSSNPQRSHAQQQRRGATGKIHITPTARRRREIFHELFERCPGDLAAHGLILVRYAAEFNPNQKQNWLLGLATSILRMRIRIIHRKTLRLSGLIKIYVGRNESWQYQTGSRSLSIDLHGASKL